MQLRDGGHVSANGGQLHPAVGHLGHVPGDRRHLGWQVGHLMMLTVILKAAQVGRVPALRILCSLQARLDVATDGKGKLD
ncbi:hypothetical protein GCM10027348_39530 [Hymenobacter tenuis]